MITLYEDAMGFTKMVDMAKLMCAFPMVLREHLTGVGHKPVSPPVGDTQSMQRGEVRR